MFKKILFLTFVLSTLLTPFVSKAEMIVVNNNQNQSQDTAVNEKETDESLKSPEEIAYIQQVKEQKRLAKNLLKKMPHLTPEQALSYAQELKEYKNHIDENNEVNEERESSVLDP